MPIGNSIVDLYRSLVDKVDAAGESIGSIVQVVQTTVTTYLKERTFDPKTGKEASPMLHAVDVASLTSGEVELQAEIETIKEIKDIIAVVTPEKSVSLKPKAK